MLAAADPRTADALRERVLREAGPPRRHPAAQSFGMTAAVIGHSHWSARPRTAGTEAHASSLVRRARNAAALTRFWQAVEQNWRPALREVST